MLDRKQVGHDITDGVPETLIAGEMKLVLDGTLADSKRVCMVVAGCDWRKKDAKVPVLWVLQRSSVTDAVHVLSCAVRNLAKLTKCKPVNVLSLLTVDLMLHEMKPPSEK